ncbi:MAG: amidase [Chloroflexota bacterium]
MATLEVNAFSSIHAMLDALERRTVSAVELLDLHLARIERFNSAVNAIVTLCEDTAYDAARRADRTRSEGTKKSLLGLPLTIKDTIDVEDLPTTAGIRDRRKSLPLSTARVVRRLQAEGAVLMGKSNVPPYAGNWQTDNSLFGRSNNPWNLDRTPGGSSGGGAAALASGLTPLEIGSDIGGSIRVPASFCGVYGHRPSDTALPRSGHFPGSSLPNAGLAVNVLGPLARDAQGIDLALRVASGPEPGEDIGWRLRLPPARHGRLRDYRVAVLPWLDWLPVDPEIVDATESLMGSLAHCGVTTEQVGPEGFANFRGHHESYVSFVAAIFNFGRETPSAKRRRAAQALEQTGDEFDAAEARGLLASAHEFLALHARREQYREAYRRFFATWDVLLTPVTIVPAFPHARHPVSADAITIHGKSVPYSRLMVYPGVASFSGQPATAFPLCLSREGLPIGLQAVGPYLEDRTPIRFAELIAREYGGFVQPSGFE